MLDELLRFEFQFITLVYVKDLAVEIGRNLDQRADRFKTMPHDINTRERERYGNGIDNFGESWI